MAHRCARWWLALVLGLLAPRVHAAASSSVVIIGPDDGFTLDRDFGSALALDGDTLFVGSAGAGARYVRRYLLVDGTWTFAESVGEDVDHFGGTIAIDAQRMVVGGWDDLGEGGLVAIYDRSGGAPVLTDTLTDPSAGFGRVVGLADDVLVVLAQEGAHVYRFSGAAWAPEVVLTDPISAERLAVGSGIIASANAYEGFGTVWLYGYDGMAWTLQRTLAPRDRGAIHYGLGLALEGETLVVASNASPELDLLARNGGAWDEVGGIELASGGLYAGELMALRSDLLLVGDQGTLGASGSATLLRRAEDGSWTTELTLAAGRAVALDGTRLALGRPWIENRNGTDVGEVEIVDVAGAWLGTACAEPDDCASGWCAGGVCCNDHCTGACDVCRADEGALADGQCTRVVGPQCCYAAEDCGAPPTCSMFACSPDNTCELYMVCCTSDDECPAQPPCAVHCVDGGCVAEEGCVPETTGAVDSSGASVSATIGDGTSGVGEQPDSSGGCGCASTRGAVGTSLLLALFALRRRRRSVSVTRGIP